MNDIIQYFDVPQSFDAKLSAIAGALVYPESTEDLEGVKTVLFHVHDPRWTDAAAKVAESDFFQSLAELYLPIEPQSGIAILGTFKNGASLKDTEAGLREVLIYCIRRKIIPVVVSNCKLIVETVYSAFKEMELIVSLTSISKDINLGVEEDPGFIGKLIREQPNYLFNYTNIGYQTYYNSGQEVELADSLYFDAYRLGETRGNVASSEPLIRSSEFIHFSLDSIKSSDFRAVLKPEPNGFYSEEVCQMTRYAGLNEKLRILVLSEYEPSESESDKRLLAQMLWCFLDGLVHRQNEMPGRPAENFLRYSVGLKGDQYEVVFFKSLKTDRWWMEVPLPPNYINRYVKHYLLPCSYEDYLVATTDEIPERWWRAYQKML